MVLRSSRAGTYRGRIDMDKETKDMIMEEIFDKGSSDGTDAPKGAGPDLSEESLDTLLDEYSRKEGLTPP